MYHVVAVRKTVGDFTIDHTRIFLTNAQAQASLLEKEDAVVEMMNSAQLLLALVRSGMDVDTAHDVIDAVV